MTKAQLAEIVGVTPTSIGNYCNGRIPRADELHRIAKVFGVSMETLLTGQGQMAGRGSDSVWKIKAEHAEQKLEAVKAALTGLIKKI